MKFIVGVIIFIIIFISLGNLNNNTIPDITYLDVKKIFDINNNVDGYKQKLDELISKQLTLQEKLEKFLDYHKSKNSNKSEINTFKFQLMSALITDKVFLNYLYEIKKLLNNTDEINKGFYEKLYNIQINFDKKQREIMRNIVLEYGTEKEKTEVLEIISDIEYEKEYIILGTNKNMLDNFNN